jgi:hypothetical protein
MSNPFKKIINKIFPYGFLSIWEDSKTISNKSEVIVQRRNRGYDYKIEVFHIESDEYLQTYMADGPQFKFYEFALYVMVFTVPKIEEPMVIAVDSSNLTYEEFTEIFTELTIKTVKEQADIEDVDFNYLDRRFIPRLAHTYVKRLF